MGNEKVLNILLIFIIHQFLYCFLKTGVDSIAFVLFDSQSKQIAVINEYKDPIAQFVTTAFGGSIDDEKYYKDLRILVRDEVEEESGFKITNSQIHYHGKVLCNIILNH